MVEKEKDDFHPSFLSGVHLKGYKSIRNTKVRLNKGLNIIIGPNGSGKSNFLDFLYDQRTYGEINEKTYSEIIFQDSDGKYGTLIRKTSKIEYDDFNKVPYQEVEESLKVSGQKPFERKERIENEKPIIINPDISQVLNFTKLSFGFPEKALGLTESIPFKISASSSNSKNISIETPGVKLISGKKAIPLFDSLIYSMFHTVFRNNENIPSLLSLGHSLTEPLQFLYNKDVISNLKIYTPIQGLKFDDGLRVETKKTNGKTNINIDYLRLAFKVENDWLTWDMLSDGTKRLFYLVFMLSQDQPHNKYLIEEPELGVHPDQLFKLMNFIKEKSETNQIILTTHSPQVLNILNKDELDRIIITKYTKRSGTKMRHLSEEEIIHAKSVMSEEGLFLSDYWVHLNLEEGVKW